MHKLDVLDAYLPEFGNLRCMAQYDRYHIYTVDEHTLRAVLLPRAAPARRVQGRGCRSSPR